MPDERLPPRRWRNSAAILRSGEDPVEVAQKVMRAIKEEELYTFTHPEYRTLLEERFQRIPAAYLNLKCAAKYRF
jgi:hypothetical protein